MIFYRLALLSSAALALVTYPLPCLAQPQLADTSARNSRSAEQVPAEGQPGSVAPDVAVPSASSSAASDSQPAQIVITARKRVERLQDVPDAVSVVSAKEIQTRGIRQIGDVVTTVPGVSIAEGQNPGTVTLTVRGISQVRNGEAPVAVVVDGVQLSSPNQITQDLYDIERIEVLKGPQGALYGRNAIAGAINIVTRAPTNDFEASTSVTYENGDDRKIQGVVSGPIVKDVLLARVAGGYEDFDGLITNEFLKKKVDFRRDANVRGRMIWKPVSNLSLDFRGSYADLHSGVSYYIPLPDGMPNNTSIPVQSDVLGKGFRRLGDLALKADYQLPFGTITSISAYSRTHEFFHEDLDWLPVSILEAAQDLSVTAKSEEIRLTSDSHGRLRYIVGAYALGTHRDLDTFVWLNVGSPALLLLPVIRERNKNFAWAGFGQVALDVAAGTELAVALRYDSDRRRQFDPNTSVTRQHTFGAWQPKVTVSHKFTPDVMGYVSYAEGFRSGGFNAPNGAFPSIYKAEGTRNYELGFKTSLLNRKVSLNGALYHTDYRNEQIFLLDAKTAAQGVVNINKVRVQGAELELFGRPLPGLDVNASMSFVDSNIRDFNGTGLYVGNRSPYVHRWTSALGAQYTHRLGSWDLTGRAEYSRRSGLYFHIDNADKQSPINLVNVRLIAHHGSLTFNAFVENLFDEKYSVEFFAHEFIGTVTDIRWPSEPRRYGITARVDF